MQIGDTVKTKGGIEGYILDTAYQSTEYGTDFPILAVLNHPTAGKMFASFGISGNRWPDLHYNLLPDRSWDLDI